mmetsp:Transcript_41156/g.124366  ORF Transcript_41156/g.124366 Transcript_41156/m.124366 type:complete len:226 (+) Transcript_41156:1136-1813(+)
MMTIAPRGRALPLRRRFVRRSASRRRAASADLRPRRRGQDCRACRRGADARALRRGHASRVRPRAVGRIPTRNCSRTIPPEDPRRRTSAPPSRPLRRARGGWVEEEPARGASRPRRSGRTRRPIRLRRGRIPRRRFPDRCRAPCRGRHRTRGRRWTNRTRGPPASILRSSRPTTRRRRSSRRLPWGRSTSSTNPRAFSSGRSSYGVSGAGRRRRRRREKLPAVVR